MRKRLRKSIQRIDDWPLKALQWDDLYCGIRRAYKEARQAFAAACDQPNDENFHEWRKRVKELWYDLRILGAVRPEVMDDLAYQAKVLGEYLGEDRDLAVAGSALEEKRLNKASSQVLASLIERRRFQLQRATFDFLDRLFVEKPKGLCADCARMPASWLSVRVLMIRRLLLLQRYSPPPQLDISEVISRRSRHTLWSIGVCPVAHDPDVDVPRSRARAPQVPSRGGLESRIPDRWYSMCFRPSFCSF